MSRFRASRAEAEVWATAESGAGRHDEGSVGRPGRRDPAYVLPYTDREQFGALLASLEPRLTAVALRLTRDRDVAQDVVQSAFEKVVLHAPRYRGAARVSTWVHRIVANEALMWLRAERRRRRVLDPRDVESAPPPVDEHPSPGERLDRAHRYARLHRGIARLTPEEREVLVRCALEGRTYSEHAHRTGSHPAAVKSRAHRARGRLRSWLDAEAASGEPPG